MFKRYPNAARALLSITSLICSFACTSSFTAITLVTPNLQPAVVGNAYSGGLLFGSTTALTSIAPVVLGGLGATSSLNGVVELSGMPGSAGSIGMIFSLTSATDGINIAASLPVQGPFRRDAFLISAGELHTCAVVGGGVQCWGFNREGQLGNGNTNWSFSPTQAIASGSGAMTVDAGHQHSCALVSGGVRCWGQNSFGALGNGNTTPSLAPVEAFPPGSGIDAVAAGAYHTCIAKLGGVQCFGHGTHGALGNGSNASQLRPVEAIAPSSGVTAIAAAGSYSCAVVAGGVTCWGENSQGQLGTGSTQSNNTPAQVLPAGAGATSISARASTTCTVVSGGVKCWGYNHFGQAGAGAVMQSNSPVDVLPAASGVTAVAAGYTHSCAVVSGGIRCWGSNVAGQLGVGPNENRSDAPIVVIADGSGATAVTAGLHHTCALVQGVAKCWGENLFGQLGNTPDSSTLSPTVTAVAETAISRIDAGSGHTCFVTDGGVRCFGRNDFGQLGAGTTTYSAVPLTAVPTASNTTDIAAGDGFTCAVVNGGVQCWGLNGIGALGINQSFAALQTSSTPVQTLPPASGVTAVSTGFYAACAVVNGGVQCWGSNPLGDTSISQSFVPIQTIPAVSGVVSVAVGSSFACALANSGVLCWGGAPHLTNTSYTLPAEVIPVGSGVTAIAAGYLHMCAVVAGGLKCWGDNTSGQLGNGTFLRSPTPVDVYLPGSNVTGVAASSGTTCALVAGGVSCWGSTGSLGNGTPNNSNIPVNTIPAGSGVQRIASGFFSPHTCATFASGVVACWGTQSHWASAKIGGRERIVAIPLAVPTRTRIVGAQVADSQTTLDFSPVADTGGVPLTGYKAVCLPGAITETSSVSPIVVNGLMNGVTYSCEVHATNAIGAAPASDPILVTPPSSTVLQFVSIDSRKQRAGNSPADVSVTPGIPFNGAISIDPRVLQSDHVLVLKLSNPIASIGGIQIDAMPMDVNSGGSFSFSGNELAIGLPLNPHDHRLRFALTGVNGSAMLEFSVGFLVGDVSSSGIVTAADLSAIKARVGQPVVPANIRFDLNGDGVIDAVDLSIAKSRAGLRLN